MGRKWKPQKNGMYFYPCYSIYQFRFHTDFHLWVDDPIDKRLLKNGWVFKTEQEAEAVCEKLNKVIKETRRRTDGKEKNG